MALQCRHLANKFQLVSVMIGRWRHSSMATTVSENWGSGCVY